MKTNRTPEISLTEKPVTGAVNAFVDFAADRESTAEKKAAQWIAKVYKDYTALEKPWRQLESWGRCTLFQQYDSAAAWYEAAYSCGTAEPLVIVVSAEGGGITWILPLCISHQNKLKVISFADLGVTDYAAPLIAPGAPSDPDSVRYMLKAVLAALPPCDLINFQKLVVDIQGINNPLLFLQGLKRFPVGAHGIRITEPWPALAPKIMQRRMYNTIRRKKKALEEKGVIAIERCDTPETMGPALERFITMRDARFKKIGRSAMPPLWKKYYRNLMTRQSRAFNGAVTTMTINGDPVAICFGLTRGKTYYALLSTFKMGEWESYRPGLQLFYMMLTEFAEKTGYDGYFDFTIGDEDYKIWFGGDSRALYEWMAPRSLRGFPYYAAWRAKSFVRRYPLIFSTLQKTLFYLRAIKEKSKD